MNTDDSALFGAAAAPALQVMSWNVRRRRTLPSARGADRWNTRAPRLRSLLSAERPTLLGAQEARTDQAEFLRSSLGMRYGIVGRGRGTGGRGEGCPILYDAERLELLDWNQTALSDRPDRPGSVSWGNIIPRILVTASFHDRATGQTFLALNTHFDHLSERSRRRSAQAVRGAAAEVGCPPSSPVTSTQVRGVHHCVSCSTGTHSQTPGPRRRSTTVRSGTPSPTTERRASTAAASTGSWSHRPFGCSVRQSTPTSTTTDGHPIICRCRR